MQQIQLFKLGAVVSWVDSYSKKEDFGHITGFSRNCYEELVIKVKFL